MPQAPAAERTALGLAAATLDGLVSDIVARWVERVAATIYAAHPELDRQELADHAPDVVRGVAEALRRGEPKAFDAPWTAPARGHALERLRQHMRLGDLVREYQIIREEIWHALRRYLSGIPTEDVYDIAENLDAALDTMITISTATYGDELQRALARTEAGLEERRRLLGELEAQRMRVQTVLEQMPSGVFVAEAPTGRLILGNRQAAEIWRQPFITAATAEEYRTYHGFHPDGRPYAPEEWPVIRALRGEPVSNEEVHIVRGDGTRGVTLQSAAPIRDDEGRIIAAVTVLTDITERRQAEAERERLLAELRQSNQHLVVAGLRERELTERAESRAAEFDAAIGAVRDGLIIYGPHAEVLRMNRAAEQLLGTTQAEYAALPLETRQTGPRVETPEGTPFPPGQITQARALRGEVLVGVRARVHRRDGSSRELLISAGPIRDDEGHIVGAVRSLSDVTPMIELQEQRDDIVRAVSHDLRQPLAAILGQAQLCERRLARANLERERDSAASIVSTAQRMNTMIQDLVDAARSEAGQLSLERQPVDLRAFAFEIKQRLAPSLETARIEVQMPLGLPPVWADPARLERILTNLWSNALKYSAPGTPVTVQAWQEDGRVITAVIDRGRGIAAEDLPRLFQRYFRGGATRERRPGVGLGLYITRRLVEAHDGHIWAESQVGVGSTFSFSLPVAQTDTLHATRL
ncbi:MAG TPA: ATP-binding protein [Anaerolineae bacterium]|nr:ATP-binding protein [Anaerolineae bacterium]HOQ98783.1 ATP-binding protein [Anaerolineae bacterium]HPL28085.1 ATP-binding protein [Anaerolineae bacterium]